MTKENAIGYLMLIVFGITLYFLEAEYVHRTRVAEAQKVFQDALHPNLSSEVDRWIELNKRVK